MTKRLGTMCATMVSQANGRSCNALSFEKSSAALLLELCCDNRGMSINLHPAFYSEMKLDLYVSRAFVSVPRSGSFD